MSRILLDVDGVLCDFVSGYLELVKRVGWLGDFTLADVTDWSFQKALGLSNDCVRDVEALLFEPGFVRGLSSLPGTYEGVAALEKAGHDLVFVTSPWRGHPTWAHERDQWITERWPDAKIVSTNQKQFIKGDVLIDDKPEHVERWCEEHVAGFGLVWDAPYNRERDTGDYRVTNWSDVLECIELAGLT